MSDRVRVFATTVARIVATTVARIVATAALAFALLAAGAAASPPGSPPSSSAPSSPSPPPPSSTPPPPSATIPANVLAGGVDVSNLTIAAATTKIATQLTPRLDTQIVVGAESRVFRLAPARAGRHLDAAQTANNAYAAAAARSDTSTVVSVPAVVTHSRAAVAKFVATIAGAVERPPLDARVRITLKHVYVLRGRDGLRIPRRALTNSIDAALDSTTATRVFHVALRHSGKGLSVRGLARRYPAIVTIDRAHFRLRLFVNLRFRKSYGVAVGRAGLSTPAGLYHVNEREINPSWHVPNASWAGSLAGQTIPPGPGDPIKARWLGLADGVGIHGTAEDWSIGSRASHGCIRMHVSDVIELYRRVPLGTPVLIR